MSNVSRLEPAARTPPNVSFNITQDTSWQSTGHFPITLSSSSAQTTYVGTVFFQFSSSDTRAPPNLTSQTAAAVEVVPKSVPMSGCVQRVVLQYFTRTVPPPFCAATVAFHRLVVTLVLCTGPWVGARCLPAGSFRVKAGPRRRLAQCKFTLLPAVACRIRDVSRLGACKTDGWIASSSVCVDVTMRRFSCASHSRHPPASQRRTSSSQAGAWADEIVLDTHVASMALHGRSSVARAALSLHGVVSIGASVPVFK